MKIHDLLEVNFVNEHQQILLIALNQSGVYLVTKKAGSVTTSGPTRTSLKMTKLFESVSSIIQWNLQLKLTPLFNEGNCSFECFCHFAPHHYHWQPPPVMIMNHIQQLINVHWEITRHLFWGNLLHDKQYI